jgi:outer membrane receptor protein involved in Fe transport
MQQQTGLDYTDARNNPSSDIRSVDLDYTPWHTATNTSFAIQIESKLTDSINMDLSYAYSTRDYEDSQDYDHSVSVRPYAIGPITTWLHWDRPSQGAPIVGINTYASNGTVDYAATESEWTQTEARFYSDFDGAFNFSAGLFYLESGSQVDYDLAAPYMNYWGNTSNGPLCGIFPDSCGYGSAVFWSPWFQSLPGGQAYAAGLAQAGFITPDQIGGVVLKYATDAAMAASDAACGGKCPLLPYMQQYNNDSNSARNTLGIYGEMYFDLSDKTTITLGARHTKYEIDVINYVGLIDLQGITAGWYGQPERPQGVKNLFDADKNTFKIGVDHSFNDDHLLYVTLSTGFKPGGTNPTSGDGVPFAFGAEEATVLEIGSKSTFLDGRL